MATVGDSELVRLAAAQRAELFPVFRRIVSFGPLVVLLAVVPGLYALIENPDLPDLGALWGLKSIEVLTGDGLGSRLDPPSAPELRWQNPLGSWLTAASMWIIGPSRPLSLILVGYLAHAAVVGSCFVLTRRLFDERFGFWVTVMLACHGPFLQQIDNPVPNALGLWLGIVALWGFVAHLDEGEGVVSWYLLAGGVALGACLISGGPLALAVTLVLLLYVLSLRGEQVQTKRAETVVRKRFWVGRPALKSLAAWILTGFAVGGWWVLMMSSYYGSEFRSAWLMGRQFVQHVPSEWTGVASRLLDQLGLLAGFVFLGIWQTARELLLSDDETRRRPLYFLVAWAGVGLLVWQAAPRLGAAPNVIDVWASFFVLAFITLAAVGVESIVARRFSVWQVAAVVTAAIGVQAAHRTDATVVPAIWLGLGIFVVGTASWGLQRWCGHREPRRRQMLSALVIAPILANAWLGLAAVRSEHDGHDDLRWFAQGVAGVNHIGVCLIVSADPPPPQLSFSARSLWPDAQVELIEQWDQAADMLLADALESNQPVLLVEWGSRESKLANMRVDSVEIEQIAQPRQLRSRELKTFLLKPR